MEILHQSGFGLSFNATDALKRVDNKQDLMKVAVADEWQRLRYQFLQFKLFQQAFAC